MKRRGIRANPFYVVLVLAGVAFTLTASAYGVMTVRQLEPDPTGDVATEHGLMQFMDQHGFRVMMIELAVLAVATLAAIGTDEFWARRAATREERQAQPREQDVVSVATEEGKANESATLR